MGLKSKKTRVMTTEKGKPGESQGLENYKGEVFYYEAIVSLYGLQNTPPKVAGEHTIAQFPPAPGDRLNAKLWVFIESR